MWMPTLLALVAMAFPIQAAPPKDAPKPAPPSIEEVVARALQTHPEILAADAKLAGAKADLELARLSLSQRILKAKNRLDSTQLLAGNVDEEWKLVEAAGKSKAISTSEVNLARAKSLLAKSQLAEAQAEWKMYAPDPKPDQIIDVQWTYTPLTREAAVTQAERDRVDILSRSVKMKKAENLDLVEATKLLQALPELKGLTLRVPTWVSKVTLKAPPVISWEEREMSVAGWLQFFADVFNPQAHADGGRPTEFKPGQYDWYIREYGLVFVEDKPVGAPTLAEFLKTVRGAPAPKK